jgi:hypothetical protein
MSTAYAVPVDSTTLAPPLPPRCDGHHKNALFCRVLQSAQANKGWQHRKVSNAPLATAMLNMKSKIATKLQQVSLRLELLHSFPLPRLVNPPSYERSSMTRPLPWRRCTARAVGKMESGKRLLN